MVILTARFFSRCSWLSSLKKWRRGACCLSCIVWVEAYVGQKSDEKLSSSSGLFWSPGMCSLVSQPAMGLGSWRMTSCCYRNWNSHYFYPMQWCAWLLSVYIFKAFITVLLGLLWSRLIVGSQPHFWTQKGITLWGSTSGLGTSPGHCAKFILSGQGLDAHPNTFRKLFSAETFLRCL